MRKERREYIVGFKIKNGVLKEYRAEPGVTSVTIPSSVTSIGACAFYGCSSLRTVEIPTSVTSIGEFAFNGCSSLRTVEIPSGVARTKNIFYNNMILIERNGDETRVCAYVPYFHYNDEEHISVSQWNEYDLELINNGLKYKYRLIERLFGGLDRLLHPVELSDENRQLYIELIRKNVKKVVTFAEENNCPMVVKSLLELGLIDESNFKAIRKCFPTLQCLK